MSAGKRGREFWRRGQKPKLKLKWRSILLAFVLYLPFIGILVFNLFPPSYGVTLGSIASHDIVAQRNVVYIDQEKTKELQDLAEQAVMPVYNKDFTPARQNLVRTQINNYYNLIEQVSLNGALPYEEKIKRLKQGLPSSFNDDAIAASLEVDPSTFTTLLSYTIDIALQFLEAGIKEEDMSQLPLRIQEKVGALGLPPEAKKVMAAVCESVLTPNLTLDEKETAYRKQLARQGVDPVRVNVTKGEVVVKKGELITEDKLAALKALGVYRSTFPWSQLISIVLVCLAVFLTWAAFSLYFLKDFLTPRRILFAGLLFLFVTFLCHFMPLKLIFLTPLPFAGMVISALFGFPFALVFVIFSSLGLGMIQGNDFLFAFALFMGSASAAYFSRQILKTGDLLASGLKSGLVLAFVAGAAGFYLGKEYLTVLEEMGWSLLNGGLSGIFAIFILLLHATQSWFRLTSPLHLLEISNPNHPLLKRLLIEAPGTYHHSIMVASLAEGAASAIGANILLARTAGYFHDVGKIARPEYFVENQGDFNIHNRITPQLSTQVIVAHTRDGLDIARNYSLPEPIMEIIASHHGTTLASYFYWQAQQEGDGKAAEEVFRYPGPKPETKEAAIVMLADGVEAAVRSLKEKTPERIRNMVDKIVGERVQDGQLACSDLSFKELEKVKVAFARILIAAYHLRPEYPEGKKEKGNGGHSKQSTSENQASEKTTN